MYFYIESLNCRGQTCFTVSKQLLIQEFLKFYLIDILLCQETSVDNESFKTCDYILNKFSILKNNALNDYRTLCLARNDLEISNVNFDTAGRMVPFNINDISIVNIYLTVGTDAHSRYERETLISDTLPNLIIDNQGRGIIMEDWNCIVKKQDCTHFLR